MSKESNTRILRDTLQMISNESVLTEEEALEVIRLAMIYHEWLYFFAPKIIELANRGEIIEVIISECYSLMTQIRVCGGLEYYKIIKGLA